MTIKRDLSNLPPPRSSGRRAWDPRYDPAEHGICAGCEDGHHDRCINIGAWNGMDITEAPRYVCDCTCHDGAHLVDWTSPREGLDP